MLYKINPKNKSITRVKRAYLRDFGWNERRLQALLFKNLEEIIQTEALLIISQSRSFQEEPDLMAIDENGDLWIFELKAWESQKENILQALRYGQIFGQFTFDDLDQLFFKISKEQRLLEAHRQRFPDKKIPLEEFNQKQHYVIITNGLDIETRQAIKFWKDSGMDVMPWVYRLYQEKETIYFEFNPFIMKADNPFEDIESKFFILNTDRKYLSEAEQEMIKERKAAAYYSRKTTMKRIQPQDKVFLYSSGKGIIAGGGGKNEIQD